MLSVWRDTAGIKPTTKADMSDGCPVPDTARATRAGSALERQPQRELHRPRVPREGGDGRERRRVGGVAVGQAQVGAVEDVEDVPAQLGAHARAEAQPAREGEVQALPARPAQ